MGGVESSLPHRVNLVFGGQHVLAKRRHGDCPVDIVPLKQMLALPSGRTRSDFKWLAHMEGDNRDSQGRPTICIIRNDRHPQRSLCAEEEVSVNGYRWTAKHRWLLEYVDVARTADAVGAPFHLCSLWDKRYLVVDKLGTMTLQAEKPETLFWEFQDATSASAGQQRNGQVGGCFASLPSSPGRQLDPSPASSPTAAATIKQFEGSLVEAFSGHTCTADKTRKFTPPDVFVASGLPLGEEVRVADASVGLAFLFEVLLGPESDFRRSLADGEDPIIEPLQRLSSAAWCYVGAARQTLTVPVKGRRPFEEELRVALCRGSLGAFAAPSRSSSAASGGEASSGEGSTQAPLSSTDCGGSSSSSDRGPVARLAIHFSSVLKVGWPVGDFVTETLHLFSQDLEGGPGSIYLRSYGKAQPGSGQKQALEGMKESRKRFLASATSRLEAAWSSEAAAALPASTLRHRAPSLELPSSMSMAAAAASSGRDGGSRERGGGVSCSSGPVARLAQALIRCLNLGIAGLQQCLRRRGAVDAGTGGDGR